jgi:hypothetical protein
MKDDGLKEVGCEGVARVQCASVCWRACIDMAVNPRVP